MIKSREFRAWRKTNTLHIQNCSSDTQPSHVLRRKIDEALHRPKHRLVSVSSYYYRGSSVSMPNNTHCSASIFDIFHIRSLSLTDQRNNKQNVSLDGVARVIVSNQCQQLFKVFQAHTTGLDHGNHSTSLTNNVTIISCQKLLRLQRFRIVLTIQQL